jgi:uncharacterized protein (DUF2147 family)
MRRTLSIFAKAVGIFAAVPLAFVMTSSTARATSTLDPHGVWLRPEGGVEFSFYDCGKLLCAKVVGAKKAEDKASIGSVILRGAAQTGPHEWKGKLFNSEDGKTYDGIITVTSADELTLKGCIMGILCGGETWKRAPAPVAAPAGAHPQAHAMVDEAR